MKIKPTTAISESGFIFDSNTGDSYTVNSVGLEILLMLKEQKTFDQIATFMINKYDVALDEFERYYTEFLLTLKQLNFIEE
jgi:hypothetical protein